MHKRMSKREFEKGGEVLKHLFTRSMNYQKIVQLRIFIFKSIFYRVSHE